MSVDTFAGRTIDPAWETDRTPDQMAFKRLLISLRDMTEEDLAAAVAELPDEIKARLAEGPVERRYTCGVCEAFGRRFYRSGPPAKPDARWRVWAWHEIPKLFMGNNRQLHYGALANETYKRCLAIYRAAGWAGDAPEPNA